MKSWAEIGFEIETTGDGSPTLRLLQSVDPTKYRGESMHHSGGAWAETLLIYGGAARGVLKQTELPHFLVLGLGLGCIEMAIAREALLLEKKVGLITSFESVPELREFFWLWLHGKADRLQTEVWHTYELMAAHVVSGTDLQVGDLKKFLCELFPHLESFHRELGSDFTLPSRYHGIMYDAFSSKTTPHLWEEEFLIRFLNGGASEKSVLATYACRLSLKQALQHKGFEVLVRRGFQGKRNSTLALRNFPNVFD